jgi:hypothetical protein
MLPSACSFIVVVSLSYIQLSLFYTTWPSSSVYDIFTFMFLQESAALTTKCKINYSKTKKK